MKTVYVALPLACLATLAVHLFYFAPLLSALASGGVPFDARIFGYSPAEARAYLSALSPAGTALYLGQARLVDTLFPILLTLTLCLPLQGRGQFWFLPALAYGLFDLTENLAVSQVLRAGPDVGDQAVTLASNLTQAKYATLAVAVLIALAALWRLWRDR